MRVGTAGFRPERLIQARKARRISSKSALARELSINASTVTRWEAGSSSPDAEGLIQLASHLRVRPEFFLRPSVGHEGPFFLRSLSSTLIRDLAYQESQAAWLQEVSGIIEHYVDFPKFDVPDFLGTTSYRQLRDEDIEEIAVQLRAHWGLGDGPCTDIVATLEKRGFVIAAIEMGTSRLDGLCSWSSDGRPHVLLANDKMSYARRQMDAAHEMAHAILHKNISQAELAENLPRIEEQAFRLASAFLLPATSYPIEVHTPSLNALLAVKERWRVSIKAQIKRLSDLEAIPPEYATQLYKLYSAKGWSKGEPLDKQWLPSEPRMLKDALYLIVSEGVRSKADLLAAEFTIPAADVENLTGLPAGWFSRDPADIVQLKSTMSDGLRREGQVINLQDWRR